MAVPLRIPFLGCSVDAADAGIAYCGELKLRAGVTSGTGADVGAGAWVGCHIWPGCGNGVCTIGGNETWFWDGLIVQSGDEGVGGGLWPDTVEV